MKAFVILVAVLCYVECKKTYAPIDKNANIAFINMEGGGGVKPGSNTKQVLSPTPAPVAPNATPAKPAPAPQPTQKPVAATVKPASPPASPQPAQIKPKPVYPSPVPNPITTPGPGSVKQLVNFYDSQGKGSPIRPYSYSQAVKQG